MSPRILLQARVLSLSGLDMSLIPFISLEARLWTFSNASLYFCLYGDQMQHA